MSVDFITTHDDPTPHPLPPGDGRVDTRSYHCRVARVEQIDANGAAARICRLPAHTIALAPELCAGLQIGDVVLIAAVRPASFGFGPCGPWTAVAVLAVERAS